MVSIDQLGYFKESNPLFKIVKPWWDILADYVAAAMLALAVLAGAMQATSGDLYCLPTVDCSSSMNQSVPTFGNNIYCKDSGNSSMLIKLQDRRQYDFIEAECKKEAVHLFVSYFPYIIFLETVLLMVVSNFWLKIPKTMYVVEHFVTLVNECYNTPGTSLNVCNTLWQTKNSDYNLPKKESGNGQPKNTESTESLETSEANKAKTLQEKVRQFRRHVEKKSYHGDENVLHGEENTKPGVQNTNPGELNTNPGEQNTNRGEQNTNRGEQNTNCGEQNKKCLNTSTKILTLRNIYCIQQLFKFVVSSVSFGINVSNLKFDDIVNCTIPYVFSESYNHFTCSNVLVPFFQLVFWIFLVLIFFYWMLCSYAVYWTILKIRKDKYDFHKRLPNGHEAKRLGNIDPASGDLAFMLYFLDKYNELYSDRFAVFLSDKDGKKLKDYILANDWPIERLFKETVDGEHTLKLTKLRGIPKTVFEMLKLGKLDKLILESCKFEDDDFYHEDWKQLRLRSLSIKNCSLTEIPSEIFKLHTLESLYLDDNKITSIPRNIQHLKQLKIFDIRNNKVEKGVEHILTIKNLTANICGNRYLEFNLPSASQDIKLIKLYVDQANMDKAKAALGNKFVSQRYPNDGDVTIVKYSTNQPDIDQPNQADIHHPNQPEMYSMSSNIKGLAWIIIFPYEGAFNRHSTNTYNLFKEIGYTTKKNDYQVIDTVEKFKDKLSEYLNEDQYDSLSIVLMGHGTKEGMYLKGGQAIVLVNTVVAILKTFDALKGKPKLIAIQACLDRESQDNLPEYTMNVDRPDCEDVVIAYSTLQSCTLHQDSEPNWFVDTLVDVFSRYAYKEDVLSLLTIVSYELYRKYMYNVGEAYKHIPLPQSTLTKKWYLFPECFEPVSRQQSADQSNGSTVVPMPSNQSNDPDSSQPSTSTSYNQHETNV